MIKLLYTLLFDMAGSTLSITTKTSNTLITASGFNTNWAEIEAVVNALTADNYAADSVTAVKLNADVVRADYGLKQHTDGTLYFDPSDTNPCLEQGDGGVRVIADGTTIERTASGLGVIFNGLKALIVNWMHPVGSLYFSTVATNPGTLLGTGTWVAFGAGKCFVGLDSGDSDFDTVEETGGAKTHTLTVGEMPAHGHGGVALAPPAAGATHGDGTGGPFTKSGSSNSAGGGGAHNNLQPYVVVYAWKRTA